MGTRQKRERQDDLWIATQDVVLSPAHTFYDRVNKILDDHHFDRSVEQLCRRYYKGPLGRPSVAPGVYFRVLLLGYLEGIDSERGIAWRLADSLSMRKFIAYALTQETPDHSTISRMRRLYAVETHKAVFRWILKILAEEGLVRGQTVSIDATTLEANAALRSLVRRDTGQKYDDYLKTLAKAAGLENPTREQLARLDRKRKKKGSNKDWKNPYDADARIAKMKDGSTHMAHKAEHAVDLSSGALLAVTLQGADQGDTTTIHQTLAEAGEAVAELIEHEAVTVPAEEPKVNLGGVEEVVADKGYHSGGTLEELHTSGCRSYIPEPERGRRCWEGKEEEQKQVYANRRRIKGARSKRLQRKRSELTERSMAHMYETGGMRRVHLKGRNNILKRLLMHAGGFNLALVMRQLFGVGKPRRLQGVCARVFARFHLLLRYMSSVLRRLRRGFAFFSCSAWVKCNLSASSDVI
ncbi:MAG: transposase [Bryobacteraceae bacterium]